MAEGIQLIIPDKQPDLSKENWLESLRKSIPKDLAYFDEAFNVYVLTPKDKAEQVNFELSYSNNRQQCNISKESQRSSDKYTLWCFPIQIIPGKCDKLKIRAWYEEIDQTEESYLKPFEPIKTISIGNIELGKENDSDEKKPAIKLVSCEKEITISPLFQMVFKSVRLEKLLISLDINSCKRLKDLKTKIVIHSVDISVANCEVTEYSGIEYPVDLTPDCTLTLAYRLRNNSGKHTKPISYIVKSTVDGFKKITTRWVTSLDPQRTNFNSMAHRIASTPNFTSSPSLSRSASSMFYGGSKRNSYRYHSGSSSSLTSFSGRPKHGLMLSVSGQTQVKLGELFRWKIQLINKSTEKMDLVLYIQSSVKKQYEKSVPPIPIPSSQASKEDPVPLFKSGQLLKSFYPKFNTVGLVSLTNNLRMNLEPGNLFETELQLVAIERGMFSLGDIKILDAVTGETFGCPKLLDVIVV